MATIQKYEDLKCWQEARIYCNLIFELIIANENIKDYPLKDQLNRSSGSIMDNIAEGFGRDGNKEFRQFLTFAKGSCTESGSQLIRAFRQYIDIDDFTILKEKSDNIAKMITGLVKYLNKSEYKGTKFMEDAVPYGIQNHEQ